MKHIKVAISAGELSGDEHAANLIKALRASGRSIEVRGMGGRNLKQAGAELLVDSERTAALMGFGLVARSLGKVLNSLRTMKDLLVEWSPDVLILVDYPDFNLRLANFAHKRGIKVFYFIPPKMWAWRSGRVNQFKKHVDVCACIFPFEEHFFASKGYDRSKFVGHPFVDQLPQQPPDASERSAFCAKLGVSIDRRIVAILPGSRTFEVEGLLPKAAEAAKILKARHPDIEAFLAVAPSIDRNKVAEALATDTALRIAPTGSLELMRHAEAGLLKSGTSNLQAAFCGLPFVMFYQASKFTQFMVNTFVRIKQFSPVNIIRPNTVPEILQDDVTGQRLADELSRLLSDIQYKEEVCRSLAEVTTALKVPPNQSPLGETAMQRAASLLINLIDSKHYSDPQKNED